jgi:hypothetical protein
MLTRFAFEKHLTIAVPTTSHTLHFYVTEFDRFSSVGKRPMVCFVVVAFAMRFGG